MLVKDIANVNPSSKQKYNNFINYIDTSSVYDGKLLNIQKIHSNFPSRAQRIIGINDILISSVRPNLLHNYFINKNINNGVASSGFIHIRVKDNLINPRFLYYFLTSHNNISLYSAIAESSQTTIPSFNKDVIENLELPDISVSKQLLIVDIIGSLDDKIENNNKLLEKCYIFLNLNMKKLMIGKNKKIISSFDDIEIISSGIDKFNNSKIYLDTSCVSDNSIVDISNNVTYTDRPSRANMKPIKNSVWFAKLKSSPKHIIVKDYSDEILTNYIFSTGFLGIKIENTKFNLLSTYFISDIFEKEKDALSIGATMQSINNDTFKGMFIPDFSLTDYISFNNLSEPILKLIYETELENIKLKKLKNTYLAKFF